MPTPRLFLPLAAAGIFGTGLIAGIVVGRSPSVFHGNSETQAALVGAKTAAHSEQRNSIAKGSSTGREIAAKLVLGDITRVPFQELYAVLALRSPEELGEVAQQLDRLPPGREADQKLTAFFRVWAQLDAPAALRAAAAMHAAQSKASAMRSVVQNADSSVAGTLASSLNEMPADRLEREEKRGLLSTVAERWSEVDPAAAAKLLDSLTSGRGIMMSWRRVAENWAANDPQAAIAWAQTHNEERNPGFALVGAIGGWWEKDPAAAQAYVTAHLSEPGSKQAAFMLAGRMFSQDPERAQQFVTAMPDVEMRRQAEQIFAGQMAAKDPQRAAEWSASLPEDVRERAMSSAVGEWARTEPNAAAQWIGNLTGPSRDQAFGAYSEAVAGRDPTGALNWAASISDAAIRGRSTERIVRRWMQQSPTDAIAWVQQSMLPDEQKQRLLTRRSPPGG